MKGKTCASWKGLLSTAAILSACATGSAQAQTQFTSITVFGESYADRGNLSCFIAKGFANCPYPSHNPFPANPPSDATQIVPFSYKLQQLYGIPNSPPSTMRFPVRQHIPRRRQQMA